jgi:voltage-gated potassium channel
MKFTKSLPFQITLLIALVVAFNLLLVHFESQSDSGISDFTTALWYFVVTITTVGYGDYSPSSTGGRVIGYIYVFASLGVLSYLFSTISNRISIMLEEKKLGFTGTSFEGHIVFLGWHDFSQMVADEIIHAGKKVAILTDRKDDVDLIYDHYPKKQVYVLFSDRQDSDTYSRMNVGKSAVVFVAMEDDSIALMDVINLRRDFKDIDIVVSLQNPRLKHTFEAAGVTYVVSRNEIASKLVASYIFEPDVAGLNLELISSAGEEHNFDIQEYLITRENPYLGMNGHEVFHRLKDDHDAVLMGVSKKSGAGFELKPNPSREIILEEGDYLMVMTDGIGQQKLTEVFGIEEGRLNYNG